MNETAPTTVHTNDNLRSSYQTVIAVTFLLITIVTALVGNTAVIMVCCWQRSLRKEVSNVLLINLSITDLSSTLLVMMGALVSLISDGWPLGEFWCRCTCAINYCLIIVSMLTMCCISIDRYQAVAHPFSYKLRVTRRRLMVVTVYTWFQGLVFGITPSALDWVQYDYWEAICAIQWHLYRPGSVVYVIVAFLLCFLGPGAVLIWCYVKIMKEVKNQKQQAIVMVFADPKLQAKHNKKVSDRTKLLWSFITIVVAYFLCTAPFSVTKLIKVSASNVSIVPNEVNLFSALLGYVSSAINPLIYGIFRRDFRKAYFQLLKGIFHCKKLSNSLTSSDVTANNHYVSTISAANQVTNNEKEEYSSSYLYNNKALLDNSSDQQKSHNYTPIAEDNHSDKSENNHKAKDTRKNSTNQNGHHNIRPNFRTLSIGLDMVGQEELFELRSRHASPDSHASVACTQINVQAMDNMVGDWNEFDVANILKNST